MKSAAINPITAAIVSLPAGEARQSLLLDRLKKLQTEAHILELGIHRMEQNLIIASSEPDQLLVKAIHHTEIELEKLEKRSVHLKTKTKAGSLGF